MNMGNDIIFDLINKMDNININKFQSLNETPKDCINKLLNNHKKIKNILSNITTLIFYLLIIKSIILTIMKLLGYELKSNLNSLIIHLLICIILLIALEIKIDYHKSLMIIEINEYKLMDLNLIFKEGTYSVLIHNDKLYYICQSGTVINPKLKVETTPPCFSTKLLDFIRYYNDNINNSKDEGDEK